MKFAKIQSDFLIKNSSCAVIPVAVDVRGRSVSSKELAVMTSSRLFSNENQMIERWGLDERRNAEYEIADNW